MLTAHIMYSNACGVCSIRTSSHSQLGKLTIKESNVEKTTLADHEMTAPGEGRVQSSSHGFIMYLATCFNTQSNLFLTTTDFYDHLLFRTQILKPYAVFHIKKTAFYGWLSLTTKIAVTQGSS